MEKSDLDHGYGQGIARVIQVGCLYFDQILFLVSNGECLKMYGMKVLIATTVTDVVLIFGEDYDAIMSE